jgi:hypothetical protein
LQLSEGSSLAAIMSLIDSFFSPASDDTELLVEDEEDEEEETAYGLRIFLGNFCSFWTVLATLALRSIAVALILERPSSEEGGVSGWREEVMECMSFNRDST